MSGSQTQAGGTAADPSMEDILASIRRILSEEDSTPAKPAAPAMKQAAPAQRSPEAERPQDVLVLDTSMLVRAEAPRPPSLRAVPPPPPMMAPPPVMEPPPPPPMMASPPVMPPPMLAPPPVMELPPPPMLAPPPVMEPPPMMAPQPVMEAPPPMMEAPPPVMAQPPVFAPPMEMERPAPVMAPPPPPPAPMIAEPAIPAQVHRAVEPPPPAMTAPEPQYIWDQPATHQPESPAMNASMTAPPAIASSETTAAVAGSLGNLVRALTSDRGAQVHSGGPTIADIVREEMRPMLKSWLDGNLAPMVERLVRAEIDRVIARAAQ